MTAAKGGFIVLFLLGLCQDNAYWHLFVVIFTACQSETSHLRKGLQLYLGLAIIFLYSDCLPVISKEGKTEVLKVCAALVPRKDCEPLIIHVNLLAVTKCATRGAPSQEISSHFPCKNSCLLTGYNGESFTLVKTLKSDDCRLRRAADRRHL